jgi:hypothetical protein
MLACVIAPAANAEKGDRNKPMTVEADEPGSVDLQRQVVIFNGNVVISQGTMLLRADRIELRERSDGFREALAIGSAERPARFRHKRDGVDETPAGGRGGGGGPPPPPPPRPASGKSATASTRPSKAWPSVSSSTAAPTRCA